MTCLLIWLFQNNVNTPSSDDNVASDDTSANTQNLTTDQQTVEADLQPIENSLSELEISAEPVRATKWTKDHPIDLVIGNSNTGVQTRSKATNNYCLYTSFISILEPKKIEEALSEPSWIEAMQEELAQFEINRVWKLVPCPKNKTVIGTRWVFRNKMDENGVVIRKKLD